LSKDLATISQNPSLEFARCQFLDVYTVSWLPDLPEFAIVMA